jgi:hypothetical protein
VVVVFNVWHTPLLVQTLAVPLLLTVTELPYKLKLPTIFGFDEDDDVVVAGGGGGGQYVA